MGFCCAVLTAAERAHVYSHESTALLCLRSMSPLQQTLVVRLLFSPSSPFERLSGTSLAAMEGAVAELVAWGLAERTPESVLLLPQFAQSLRSGLAAAPSAQATRLLEVFVERAQGEAVKRWNAAIHTIGDPTGRLGDGKSNPDLVLVQTALEEGLLSSTKKKKVEASDCVLTREGFKFLLADTHEQLWTLLLGYLKMRMAKGKLPLAELALNVAFLCRLGMAETYRPLPSSAAPKDVLSLCACLGVVHVQGGNFSVTAHARHLSPPSAADEEREGFIVLENNFRVYAYTQSLLHIRILSMFVRLEYRLPNLVVGTITRKSALKALLEYGVSAAQLLHYLRSNAHVRMRARHPVVPDAITDQLRAWEAENRRITPQEGVLFEQFPSKEAFEFAVKLAQSKGVLLWSKPWRPGQLDGFVFVKKEGVEAIGKALSSINL